MLETSNSKVNIKNFETEGRAHSKKGVGLWVFVGLGALLLLVGCGSGSTPKGEKKEKVAKSSGATPLLTDKEGVGETGKVKKSVEIQRMEVVPGYTQEELDAKHAEQRKKFSAAGNAVLPGVDQAELDARHAEQRKKFAATGGVSPGANQAELEARYAEQRKQFAAYDQETKPKTVQRGRPEGQEWFPPPAGK